jgi:Mlc titration factor MtfA (ptsG expression regulator)
MSFWARLATWLNPPDPGPLVFEPVWIEVLTRNIPLYSRLPDVLRERLHEKIAQFVRDHQFEACGGLKLTDEMVLTIAGQACMLSLRHDGPPFPQLNTVLVYPTAYTSKMPSVDAMGVVTVKEVRRLGESWVNGTVILAWDAVLQGASNCFDGHNVTLHEFAHQIDQADGRGDGLLPFACPHRYARWAEAIQGGHKRLEQLAEENRRTVLDKYGATNTAEFFAVATEAFFEKPRQLKRKQPDLYAALQELYDLDPAEWFDQG